jgi:hypothetical protein
MPEACFQHDRNGLMGLSLIAVSCLEVGVLDPSILKTERPARHLISTGARPLPEHQLARSVLPRERVRSLTQLGYRYAGRARLMDVTIAAGGFRS